MARNPFTPTFGVSPPLLVGRRDVLEDVEEALDEGVGAPGRALLIAGMRGSGKTVVLNAIEDRARVRGWIVISESTRPGLVAELTATTLPALLSEHDPEGPVDSRVTGMNVNAGGLGGGMTRSVTDRFPVQPSLRSLLTRLAEVAGEGDRGVLITLDEVHLAAAQGDVRELGQVVQHLFREGRQVALVAASLPSAVEDLLKDDVLTFLRRAERRELSAVSVAEVEEALMQPIRQHGRNITPEALRIAVQGTQGYPFMVQLVGHRIWRQNPSVDTIDETQARTGVLAAGRRVGQLVHQPSLRDLSDVDRSFLNAMAVDDGPTKMSDVAARLSVQGGYANVYRSRLLAAGLITSPRYGYVTFTLPNMREYLREHAAAATFEEL